MTGGRVHNYGAGTSYGHSYKRGQWLAQQAQRYAFRVVYVACVVLFIVLAVLCICGVQG